MIDIEKTEAQTRQAVRQVLEQSGIGAGALFVLGCSSSEIAGQRMGKNPAPQLGAAVAVAVMAELGADGIYLAAQCCEHLNRALVVERAAAERFHLDIVSAIPIPTAGGSAAAAVYTRMNDPVLVEFVKADAGLDIGGTLIGMHLKHVAVPIKIEHNIGCAAVSAARTRPKLIGGERAVYTLGANV